MTQPFFDIAAQSFQTISSFPHLLDFENSTSPTALASPHWMLHSGANNAAWEVHNGFFGNDTLTPINALGTNQRSLVFRTDTGTSTADAELVSQCIDLSSLSVPNLSFQYFTNDSTNLSVWVREINAYDWSEITPVLHSQKPRETMMGADLSLSAYSGKYVQIKFRAEANSSPSAVIIDNVLLREKPSLDLGVRRVGLRKVWAGDSVVSTVKVHYSNWSSLGNQSFTKVLKAEFINACNPSASPVLATSSASHYLPSGVLNGDLNFQNLRFNQPLPAGKYNAKYWVESVGDIFAVNDTFYTEVESTPTLTPPYFNDFESCNSDVFSYGKMQQWEISVPQNNKLGGAYSGSTCAITNADTNSLAVNRYNFLELPLFSGLDSLKGVELRFWHNFDFGSDNTNFGVVEIFDGARWLNLTSLNYPAATNWTNLISPVVDSIYPLGFTGNSNGWVQSSIPIETLIGNSPIQIRFTTTASGVPGWAIDDFEIYVPHQLSASPTNLWLNTGVAHQGNNIATIEIKNTGLLTLQSATVTIENQGTVLLNDTVSFSPALNQGESATVTLNSPLSLDTTMKQLLIYTSLPNSHQDEKTADDTLHTSIVVEDTITSLPICFDFEENPSFLSLSKKLNTVDTIWQTGRLNKVILNTAHSGSTAWYTASANYTPWADAYLYTPEYMLEGNTCYSLNFWHQYETEYSFDGGLVEFTIDSGRTWQTFGEYWSTDSTWYNTPAIQALDGYKPGWSGSSNGWVKAERSFRSFWHTTVRFRFRFASNGSLDDEGWAIDDVCIEPYAGQCDMIGLQEQVNSSRCELYPNPAQSIIHLKVPQRDQYNVRLYDAKGTTVGHYEVLLKEGEVIPFTIDHLPRGIYHINITTKSFHENIRFVKN